MTLYLVDDEKKTRESIRDYVPWGEIGITKVIAVKDGPEALDRMESDQPDLILSDIKMPKMDGIQFAEEVRERYPDCMIIFLSGYADKDNLKSAISLDAFQFIEKPVDIDTLIQITGQAVDKINARNRETLHVSNLEKIYSDSRILLEEQLLRNLCTSNQISDSTFELLSNYPFINTEPLHLFCILLTVRADSQHSGQALRSRICECISASDCPSQSLICGLITDSLLVILSGEGSAAAAVQPLIAGIRTEIHDFCDMTISESPAFRKASGVYSAFLQTKESAAFCLYYGLPNSFYDSSAGRSFRFPSSLYQHFADTLTGNDKAASEQALFDIETRILADRPPVSVSSEILQTLAACIHNESIRESLALQDDVSSLPSHVRTISDALHFTDAVALISAQLTAFYNCKWQLREYDSRIRNMIQYIQQNIGSSQLSVADIADHFSMSEAYLSSCFKSATQTTLHQYIQNARLEKAKCMLRDTNEKISVISSGIGFTDTNYFSNWFKQQTSMSPLSFRKGSDHDKEI